MVFMKILSIEHVSKSYGEKTLFQDLSFTITEKERIGLIGVNGTGKSSLLKIIAGSINLMGEKSFFQRITAFLTLRKNLNWIRI